ncbi:MAG: helix-turn-helix domain-containing protein [Ruminococcaceae bacterium]|nr:helix-turn-helix domain-containing protein [Oscillospiraceae bacterium]
MEYFVSFDQIPLVLNVKDLQKVLSVSHNTAYALIRSGAIRSIRTGRKYIIPKDAVIDYLSQN